MGNLTQENNRQLENATSYEDAILHNMIESFSCTLNNLINDKYSSSELAQRSNFNKSYINLLRSGKNKKNPSRSAVIRIAIALELNRDDFDKLLRSANHKPLDARNRVPDTLLIYGLSSKHRFDYDTFRAFLYEHDCDIFDTNHTTK